MTKEKKNIPFSTRLTETMDKRIEELSEILMLTKHDIVRVALSDFLIKNRELIDESMEYKNDEENVRYDQYTVMNIDEDFKYSYGYEESIYGINYTYDDGQADPEDIHLLATLEVNALKDSDAKIIHENFGDIKLDKNDELYKSLSTFINEKIFEEYTLKFTFRGIAVKEDPRFREYINKCIKDRLEDEYKSKK